MRILQSTLRRPALYLAAVVALTMLLAAMACGSTAQPDPAPAPTQATEASASHQHAETKPEATAPAEAAAVINMAITARQSNLSRDDLQVKRGDRVSIRFTADEAGEIHLHGYDLSAPVSPDSPGALTFVADTAGAFGINFHVFGEAGTEASGSLGGHHHGPGIPDQVVSETPVSLAVAAAADAAGSINVRIETEGFRFARELVDQAHTPGTGHAHIYMDGEKLGRVFEPDYRIADAPPGEREIRVTLNTNDHSDLVFDGEKLEATVMVNVPDVGQGSDDGAPDGDSHEHGGHDHDAPGDREVIAEVHLGNLEVYP